jgi:hypothetical protein
MRNFYFNLHRYLSRPEIFFQFLLAFVISVYFTVFVVGAFLDNYAIDLEIFATTGDQDTPLVTNGGFEGKTKAVNINIPKGSKCSAPSTVVVSSDKSKVICNIGTLGGGWDIVGSLTGKETIQITKDKVKEGEYSQKIFMDRNSIGISQSIKNNFTREYQLSVFVYVEKGTVAVSGGEKETKLQSKAVWQEVKLTIPPKKQITLQVKGEPYGKFLIDDVTTTESKTTGVNDATTN